MPSAVGDEPVDDVDPSTAVEGADGEPQLELDDTSETSWPPFSCLLLGKFRGRGAETLAPFDFPRMLDPPRPSEGQS